MSVSERIHLLPAESTVITREVSMGLKCPEIQDPLDTFLRALVPVRGVYGVGLVGCVRGTEKTLVVSTFANNLIDPVNQPDRDEELQAIWRNFAAGIDNGGLSDGGVLEPTLNTMNFERDVTQAIQTFITDTQSETAGSGIVTISGARIYIPQRVLRPYRARIAR